MKFSVLGPLEVFAGEGDHLTPIPLTQPLQRQCLAVLLLRYGQPCPRDWLIDALWGERLPNGPDTALRTCVYGVRKALGDDDNRVQTHPIGYRLHVLDGELDLAGWRTLHIQGRAALDRGDAAGAARLLQQALDLWRDPPLPDLPGTSAIAAEAARLLDQRRDARDALLDARLELGHHADLLADLRQIVTIDPTREHNWAQFMLAQYRSGHRVEALGSYTTCRQALRADFGVDPSPELQQLVDRIRSDDPGLLARSAPSAPGAEPRPPWIPVCQLPAGPPDFTGRAAEVARLMQCLPGPPGSGVPLAVIRGLAGAGKTALALHVAHQIRERFPDGQLYACLGTMEHPHDPQNVLAEMLRALGMPPGGIPAPGREREAMYRSLLAGRKVLVVADDAATAAQVRALLPGTPGSAVLATSRSRLADLDGAHQVELGALAPGEAVTLLGKIAGRDRAEAEPAAAADICTACGGLPLAVRIAGARLAARPQMTIAALAAQMSAPDRVLDLLVIGDQSVAARLAVSYGALGAPDRDAFRLLALHGPEEMPGWLVPALLGETSASGAAERLADAGLLLTAGDGRYRMHPLVRAFAAGQLALGDLALTTQALERLYTGWLQLADHAARHIPYHPHTPQPARLPCTIAPAAAAAGDPAAAVAWFAQERANLLAITARAAADGRLELAAQLAARQFAFQCQQQRHHEAAQLWQLIASAAETAGDAMAAASASYRLAVLAADQGHWLVAHRTLRKCMVPFLMARDTHALADALGLAARCAEADWDLTVALSSAEKSLDYARQAGDLRLIFLALAVLGTVLVRLGDADNGVICCEDALAIAADLNRPACEELARHARREAGRLAGQPRYLSRSPT